MKKLSDWNSFKLLIFLPSLLFDEHFPREFIRKLKVWKFIFGLVMKTRLNQPRFFQLQLELSRDNKIIFTSERNPLKWSKMFSLPRRRTLTKYLGEAFKLGAFPLSLFGNVKSITENSQTSQTHFKSQNTTEDQLIFIDFIFNSPLLLFRRLNFDCFYRSRNGSLEGLFLVGF